MDQPNARTNSAHASTAPMAIDLALSVASRCFWRIDEEEWGSIADTPTWAAFLAALVELGAAPDGRYMAVLQTPPPYTTQHAAAYRRFTGGLPGSAVPVESLYSLPEQRIDPNPNDSTACWLQQPAIYMRDLIGQLGIALPPEFSDCPDHLSLELDLASLLFASNAAEQARSFLAERLAWLPRYRAKIAQLAVPGTSNNPEEAAPEDLAFHAALVDALVDIAAQQHRLTP